MSEQSTDTNDLHLPSLSIQGFRGIDKIEIPRLGRVTLFTGKNGVGKTTLLDAVRVYAARGRYSILTNILQEREELTDSEDGDGRKSSAPNWESLFYGRELSAKARISIGPVSINQNRSIEIGALTEKEDVRQRSLFPEYFSREDLPILGVRFQDQQRSIPMFQPDGYPRSVWSRRLRSDEDEFPPEIPCASLGPSVLGNASMARFWDEVALTDHETRAVQALQLMFGATVQRVAVIGDDRQSRHGRRAVVRIARQDRPVPLKSLGDGAMRIFGVALALANSQDGFLVIDEAENGIHHSVQRDFWTMVLKTAHENNVQVFATTHSADCVAGFAQAAADVDEAEGALVWLHRKNGEVRAIEYSEHDLKIATEQDIEVM